MAYCTGTKALRITVMQPIAVGQNMPKHSDCVLSIQVHGGNHLDWEVHGVEFQEEQSDVLI